MRCALTPPAGVQPAKRAAFFVVNKQGTGNRMLTAALVYGAHFSFVVSLLALRWKQERGFYPLRVFCSFDSKDFFTKHR